MKRASLAGALLALFLCLCNCSKARPAVPSLIDGDKPLHVYGSEQSGRYYKFMTHYILGKSGRVFLWDGLNFNHVDVYDEEGSFLFQFSRFGQGPSDLQGIAGGAVDSRGDIWLTDGRQKSMKIFSPDGIYQRDWPLPLDVAKSYIGDVAFDGDDVLYFRSTDGEGRFLYFRCDTKSGRCRTVYSETRQIIHSIVNFVPDFALDDEGNLYVTDRFDYRLHVFDKEGNPLKQLDIRKGGRKRIADSDFDVFDTDFKVIRFPDYKYVLARLTGPSRFFPEIFGVDIDGGLIYVWTSERDDKARYIVDAYDKDFKRIGQACYFNMIRENAARIMGGKLYIPSIENYDTNLTRKVGPLIYLNFPERLNAYPISKEICERR